MRKYETVFISDPDLQDQARTELFEKVRNIITKENGIILEFDEWGNKKLAYEIKKKLRGHYVCVTYGGTGELVKELERNFRLSDDVMKYMTILLSDSTTAEDLENEVKEAAQAAEQVSVQETQATEPSAEESQADEQQAPSGSQEPESAEGEVVEETDTPKESVEEQTAAEEAKDGQN